MVIIVTITHRYDLDFYKYNDTICEDIFTGDYIINYSGQNQGRMDKYLIDNIKNKKFFEIYYRKNFKSNFIYLGKTNLSSIIQVRQKPLNETTESNERLLIKLNVKKSDIVNRDIGKNKDSVIKHAKLPDNSNRNLGFYKKD